MVSATSGRHTRGLLLETILQAHLNPRGARCVKPASGSASLERMPGNRRQTERREKSTLGQRPGRPTTGDRQ